LRDYELALTARDVNWQYYFSMRSFKRIDAFVAESASARLSRIAQFKADVLAYKRNLDMGRWAAASEEPVLTFDEWCQGVRTEDLFGSRARRTPEEDQATSATVRPQSPSPTDYALLRLSTDATLSDVKRQFRRLALQAHPDVTGDDGEAMRHLLAAYERIRSQARPPSSSDPSSG